MFKLGFTHAVPTRAIAGPRAVTRRFDALKEAQLWLLGDAVTIAGRTSSVAVVGGWCSVFNNHRDAGLHHPGTKDVDLLFENGATPGELAETVEDLLANGYVASAKHGFQLVRILQVGDRELAFSIDLLHPSSAQMDLVGEMFSKHVDLGIDRVPGAHANQHMQSIGTPLMATVFEHDLMVSREVEPNGAIVRLLDDTGLVISKCGSVQNAKRQRDSFDLFLAVAQPMDDDPERLKTRLWEVLQNGRNGDEIRSELEALSDWLASEKGERSFNRRVFEQVELLEQRGVTGQLSVFAELTETQAPSTRLAEVLNFALSGPPVS